jgi:hypothetical protein
MSVPDQPALGAAVKAIRTEKKISQVALSEATGFRQSWVSAVEHGRQTPSSVEPLPVGLSQPPGEKPDHSVSSYSSTLIVAAKAAAAAT